MKDLTRRGAWLLRAARLKTLPLSLSGVVFSSLYAYSVGNFTVSAFVLLCLTALSLQILSNFANDYGDGMKGTDSKRKERMVGSNQVSEKKMRAAIIFMILISIASVISLTFYALDIGFDFFALLSLGIISIIFAIKYTVGNKAYGYSGFGDVAVFIFFGWIGSMGSFYIYSQSVPLILILPASAIGLLCTAVLNLNNIRDVKTDAKFGKRTLVVRFGLKKATYYHFILILFPLLLLPVFTVNQDSNFLYLICYPIFINHLYRFHKYQSIKLELKKVSISTFILSALLGLSSAL